MIMQKLVVRTGLAAIAAAALVTLAPVAGAQQAGTGPRWQGWIGCWSPIAPAAEDVNITATPVSSLLVCITPTADQGVVDVATVSGGKVTSTEKIDASGRTTTIDSKGCQGTQRAQWSGDERRVFLRATATCDGMKSTTSGILSMTTGGDWIDVRGVSAGDGEVVRVTRYRDAGIPSAIPAEIASALSGRVMASERARIAAGAPIAAKSVIEATKLADSSVVSAWVLERGQRFGLTADALMNLADGGVPSNVTDAMIAVSNPQAFRVARADDQRDMSRADRAYGRRYPVYLEPGYYPWAWGYSPYAYGGYYDYYGYPSYYGGGYSRYGYGPYAYGGPPIVIVNGSNSGGRGQAVKGRGYTQTEPSSSGASSSGASSSRGTTTPSSSSSGDGGSSSSAPAPAARTAKPRTP
ncbi:MAG: hypothetical protein JWM95_2128 [Gemmatimonadetes bacterium]|nr:hypothetical protein [Gemmatimonadota bacterium]